MACPHPGDADAAVLAAARACHEAVFGRGMSKKRAAQEHADFAQACPAIFDFVTRTQDFDFGMLEFMLASRSRMSADAAHAAVFGRLKERYVDPLLRNMNIPTDAPVAGEEAVMDMMSRGEGPKLGTGGAEQPVRFDH